MGKMERAKMIMQDRGVLKGMKEVWNLPEGLRPEVADNFGDLLFEMGKPDYAIAAYNIAGSSQKLIEIGDAYLEALKETRKDHENFANRNKSRPGFGNVAFFYAIREAFDSATCAVRCLAAFSLAKDLDAQRTEKVEALRNEYAECADGVKKYLAACESVKSGDLEALKTIRKLII